MSTSSQITTRVLEDTLFPEDSRDNTATYHDPDWMVKIRYDNRKSYPKLKKIFNDREHIFANRDQLLEHELGLRLKAQASLPTHKQYEGWILSVWNKICHFFGYDIGLLLQQKPIHSRQVNASVKNVQNFTSWVTPTKALRDQFCKDNTFDMAVKSEFLKNSPLNGYRYYNENGELVTISDAVTSSNDRTAETLVMGRVVKDYMTSESISYTGRPDTRNRAIEQAKWIFLNEMNTNEENPKGIQWNEAEGTYELTYMVTNLMNPFAALGYFGFDEKGSILEEKEILNQLSNEVVTIQEGFNTYQVKLRPIYFSEPFDCFTYLQEIMPNFVAEQKIPKRINDSGNTLLSQLAEKRFAEMDPADIDYQLLEDSIALLKSDVHLQPEEKLFLRDLISKILNIPIVNHCKSSTDRTILALGISTVLYHWRKFNVEFPRNEEGKLMPHLILKDARFKELFAAQIPSGHQITRVSRTGEGVVRGTTLNNRALGFQWGKGERANPIVNRLLPDRYKKPLELTGKIYINIALLAIYFFFSNSLMYFLNIFSNKYQPKPWSNFSKAIANEGLNKSVDIVGKRSLLKPPSLTK